MKKTTIASAIREMVTDMEQFFNKLDLEELEIARGIVEVETDAIAKGKRNNTTSVAKENDGFILAI